MTLGARLRQARKHAKLTQESLATRSGVSQQLISSLERDKQDSTVFVVELATACGVRPQWLASGEEPMVEEEGKPVRERANALALLASPRSQTALANIIKAAEAGQLTEDDLLLLERIAARITRGPAANPSKNSPGRRLRSKLKKE